MGIFLNSLGGFIRWIVRLYIEKLVCLRFCRFKQGGSDLIYTHVHILNTNPMGATGVGHDDHTAPDDPKHNTISDADGCTFKKKNDINVVEAGEDESETIYARISTNAPTDRTAPEDMHKSVVDAAMMMVASSSFAFATPSITTYSKDGMRKGGGTTGLESTDTLT